MARITVEDCLENVSNRFGLVILASKRAKQLLAGSASLNDEQKDNRAVVNSLREIAEGKVRFASDAEIEAMEQARIDAEQAALEEAAEQQQAASNSGEATLDSIFSADAPTQGDSDESDSKEEGSESATGDESKDSAGPTNSAEDSVA